MFAPAALDGDLAKLVWGAAVGANGHDAPIFLIENLI
jgi:hypothetical protein